MQHLTIKYWLRLAQGSENHLANQAYMCAKAESHDWLDSIKSILHSNGFGYAWESPNFVEKSQFARSFKFRLLDQAHQTLSSAITISPRFHLLFTLKQDGRVRSKYIDSVQNIEDRETMANLRLDQFHNKLNSCTIQTKSSVVYMV